MEDISDKEGPPCFNICKRDTSGCPQEELWTNMTFPMFVATKLDISDRESVHLQTCLWRQDLVFLKTPGDRQQCGDQTASSVEATTMFSYPNQEYFMLKPDPL